MRARFASLDHFLRRGRRLAFSVTTLAAVAVFLTAFPTVVSAGALSPATRCPGSSSVPASAGVSHGLGQTTLWQWVAERMGVDPASGPPPVCLASAGDLALIRGHAAEASDLVAIYQPQDGLVFVAEPFDPDTPTGASILVHEFVHHAQAHAGMHFACPQEAEKPAYAAQEDWLAQYGLDLQSAFGIDGLTRLILTVCGT
jgi:Domain of unknown function (DUF6647)